MKTQFLSDQKLIMLYVSGDNTGVEELIKRYQSKIYAFINITIRDKHLADDIFQETFIKVIHSIKIGKYLDDGRFLSWVLRIAHNLMMDHFRTQNRTPVMESNSEDYDVFDILKSPDNNVVDKLIVEQIHSDVKKLIDKLPENQKQILIMRHYQDMSFKEIAEELNINMNTAICRMRYALINIRKKIKEKKIVLTL